MVMNVTWDELWNPAGLKSVDITAKCVHVYTCPHFLYIFLPLPVAKSATVTLWKSSYCHLLAEMWQLQIGSFTHACYLLLLLCTDFIRSGSEIDQAAATHLY